VRAIILTGGGSFCAGADISEFAEVRATAEQAEIYEGVVEEAEAAISGAPQPVIASISGFCLGGGLGLAQSCDFRLADATAVFGVPAAKLGIVYGPTDCRRLIATVGLANAKWILFGGERFDAKGAARLGFAENVDGDVMQAASRMAELFSSNAPLSIAGMKLILAAVSDGTAAQRESEIADALHRALVSHDYREGRAAFMERRPPHFTGS
jgi:enoyl-CoA hydratase/carnithine racemase